jgi:hypothetical protein
MIRRCAAIAESEGTCLGSARCAALAATSDERQQFSRLMIRHVGLRAVQASLMAQATIG